MAKKIRKVTIPLRIISIQDEGFHILLDVKINRKQSVLVLDTGASRTVLDIHRMKKILNKKSFRESEAISTGLGTNSMKSFVENIERLDIGSLSIRNYNAVLLDLSHVNQSLAVIGITELDGVLGGDLLKKHNAIIDYAKSILVLHR